MTTLAAGDSATFTLGSFQSLNIKTGGKGTLSFTSSSEIAQPSFTAAVANGNFGPYNVSMSVVMTMTAGSADYTLVGNADVTATTDAVTGAVNTLFNGSTISPFGITKNSVMLFGDSMTDRAWSFFNLSSSGITDNGNGTATATMATAPNSTLNQFAVGDVIRVNNSATPKFNQISATITAVSNSPTYSITYTVTGAYSDMVGSEPPTAYSMTRGSWVGWWQHFVALANAEFSIVANCTQGGCTIANVKQMLDRGYPTTTARFGILGPLGSNDAYVLGRTLAQMKADAAELINEIVGRVQIFVAFTIPAMHHSKPGYSTAKMQILQAYNRWLSDYVKSVGGFIVNSNLAASNNVTYGGTDTTYADANSGFYNTTDYVHPTGLGAYSLGKALLAVISNAIKNNIQWPSNALDCVWYDADSKFLASSATVLLSGTGGTATAGSGTISGTVPDGCTVAWTVGGTGLTATLTSPARTVSADGDAIGYNLAIAFSGTSSGASLLRFSVPVTVGANHLILEETIRGLCRVKITSPSGLIGISTTCRIVQSAMARYDAINLGDGDATLTESCTRYDVTPWKRVNTNAGTLTSVTLQVDVWTEASGTISGTVTLAHPNVQKLAVAM